MVFVCYVGKYSLDICWFNWFLVIVYYCFFCFGDYFDCIRIKDVILYECFEFFRSQQFGQGSEYFQAMFIECCLVYFMGSGFLIIFVEYIYVYRGKVR